MDNAAAPRRPFLAIRELNKVFQIGNEEVEELRGIVMGMDDPLRLAYLLSSLLDMKADEKQHILEQDNLVAKLQAIPDGEGTTLAGTLPDQAALHGMIARVQRLGLELVAVNRRQTAAGGSGPEIRTDVGTQHELNWRLKRCARH